MSKKVWCLQVVGVVIFCGVSVYSLAAAPTQKEVGSAVTQDIKSMLKSPCLDLLASSELVTWEEIKNRVDAVKKAMDSFEAKYSADIKGDVKPLDEAKAPAPIEAPVVTPAPVVAQEPVKTPEVQATPEQASVQAPAENKVPAPIVGDDAAKSPATVPAPVNTPNVAAAPVATSAEVPVTAAAQAPAEAPVAK